MASIVHDRRLSLHQHGSQQAHPDLPRSIVSPPDALVPICSSCPRPMLRMSATSTTGGRTPNPRALARQLSHAAIRPGSLWSEISRPPLLPCNPDDGAREAECVEGDFGRYDHALFTLMVLLGLLVDFILTEMFVFRRRPVVSASASGESVESETVPESWNSLFVSTCAHVAC